MVDESRLQKPEPEIEPEDDPENATSFHINGILVPIKDVEEDKEFLEIRAKKDIEGHSDALVVDFEAKVICLPWWNDAETISEEWPSEKKIDAKNVRNAQLNPLVTEPKKEVLMLSMWEKDILSGEMGIRNVYYIMENKARAYYAVQAINKLVIAAYNDSDAKLKFMQPQCEIFLNVALVPRTEQGKGAPPTSLLPCEEMLCLIDCEAVQLYTKPLDRKPTHCLRFYQEEGPEVVENVYMNNSTHYVHLDTPNHHCFIQIDESAKTPVGVSSNGPMIDYNRKSVGLDS